MPRQVQQGHQYLLPGPNVKIHQHYVNWNAMEGIFTQWKK